MENLAQEIQRQLGTDIDDICKEVSLPVDMEFYTVQPLQGFVIKTRIEQSEEFPKAKVFINVCHSNDIPRPPLVAKEEIQKAIQNNDNSSYRVPLSLSKPRSDLDKTGSVCLVFDCCIHTIPYQQCLVDEDFKFFIVDLCVTWIQEKHKMVLSTSNCD